MATNYNSRTSVTDRYIYIDGNIFDRDTPEGRMAARAYAYTVRAEGDEQTFRRIIRLVGRDDG